MPMNPVALGAALTPTVISTWFSHLLHRKSNKKPANHLSYDEGVHIARDFLKHASKHPLEDLQTFSQQRVPSAHWVRTETVTVPAEHLASAAANIIDQLGPKGVSQVGGKEWWQWRGPSGDLQGEWVEMKRDYNELKHANAKSKRIILYIHGGAYAFGSVNTHRYQLQRHARKLKGRVFARLQDCLAAYHFLLTMYKPNEIILSGDSAGGGMALAMLVTIRDRGLPLPAGGILISPWVDLTHSFPSIVTDNPGDYIPPNGFRYRPSETWPPPSVDDIATMKSHGKAASGEQAVDAGGVAKSESIIVKLDGQTIEVKDQIQMYATNQLVSHPLVSPVLQPSLGGLPPLFVLVGGGEMLRDEQFYLAHKAANPMSYAPSDALLDEHDPDREILRKYEPTYVQLQIWENMCHVAPMLSFAPPVKHMYRAIAQFGAWALARAQSTEIDILDDDGVSPIPSDVDTPRPVAKTPKRQSTLEPTSVGRAGDPLPPFFKHMIRQRVDDHGNIFPLDPPSSYRVLQIPRSQVGAINPVLVKRWVDSQKEWDEKFARDKARMKRQRVKELVQGLSDFNGESPPPSSLAARRAAPGVLRRAGGKKNYPLLLWSRLASRHDGRTIGREDKAVSSRRTSVDAKKSGAIDGTAAGRLEPTENGVDRTLSGSDEKRGEAQEDTAAGEEAGQPSNQPHEVTTPKISVDKPMSPLLVLPDDEDVKESMDEKASTRALFHARGTLPMNSQASLGHSSRPTAWTLRSQSDDVSTIGDKDSLTPAYSPKVSIDKPMSPLLVLPDDDEVKQSFDEKASTRALFHAPGTLPMTSQISLAHSNRPATIRSPSDDGSTIGEKANSALDTASTRAVHDSAGVIGLIDRPDSGATGRTMDNASTRAVLDSTGVVGLVDRPGTPASSGGLGNTEFVIPKGVIETDTEQQISRPHMPDREVFKTSLEYPEA